MKKIREDIVIIFFLGIFTIISLIGKIAFKNVPSKINLVSLLYSTLFSASIIIGYEAKRISLPKQRKFIYLGLGFLMTISLGIMGLLIGSSVLTVGLLITYKETTLYKFNIKIRHIYYLGIFLAVILPIISIYNGIIPIINPNIRHHELIKLYSISSLIFALLISYKPDIKILILGMTFTIISTFRSYSLIILIAFFIGSRRRIKDKIAISIPIILTVLLYRSFLTKDFSIDLFLETIRSIFHRGRFTHIIYENLLEFGMPFGEAQKILFSSAPREYVANLFNKPSQYTYSIVGQPAHDFGLFGLIQGWIVGLSLQDIRKNRFLRTYCVTILIIVVEIGFDALRFGILMGAAFFVLQNKQV